jgi:hypothetical protein
LATRLLAGPEPESGGVLLVRRALVNIGIALAAVAVVVGVVAIVGRVVWSVLEADRDAMPELQQLQATIARLPGVASVGKLDSEEGDLASGANGFLTVTMSGEASGATLRSTMHRMVTIDRQLATGSTRLPIEMHIGDITVGLSPQWSLDPPRLAIAQNLSAEPDVDSVVVRWADQGDNLIDDSTNANLHVRVITGGNVLPSVTAARILTEMTPLSPRSEVEADVDPLGDLARMPDYRSLDWTRLVGDGVRSVSVDAGLGSDVATSFSQIEGFSGVTGYRLARYEATIAPGSVTDEPALAALVRNSPGAETQIGFVTRSSSGAATYRPYRSS